MKWQVRYYETTDHYRDCAASHPICASDIGEYTLAKTTLNLNGSTLLQALLAALLLFCTAAYAQPTVGYMPDGDLKASEIVGIWINQSIHADGDEVGTDLWQRIEIRADGELVHDYFAADPDLGDPPPVERLFSQWSVGSYVDPDPEQGTYMVLRVAPYESQSLIAGTLSYRIFRTNFIPVFRRFSVLKAADQLTLSEPFVLVLPFTNQARSFPMEAAFLDYMRNSPTVQPSAVKPTGWGHIKVHRR
jgi:hypothetical protein